MYGVTAIAYRPQHDHVEPHWWYQMSLFGTPFGFGAPIDDWWVCVCVYGGRAQPVIIVGSADTRRNAYRAATDLRAKDMRVLNASCAVELHTIHPQDVAPKKEHFKYFNKVVKDRHWATIYSLRCLLFGVFIALWFPGKDYLHASIAFVLIYILNIQGNLFCIFISIV